MRSKKKGPFRRSPRSVNGCYDATYSTKNLLNTRLLHLSVKKILRVVVLCKVLPVHWTSIVNSIWVLSGDHFVIALSYKP